MYETATTVLRALPRFKRCGKYWYLQYSSPRALAALPLSFGVALLLWKVTIVEIPWTDWTLLESRHTILRFTRPLTRLFGVQVVPPTSTSLPRWVGSGRRVRVPIQTNCASFVHGCTLTSTYSRITYFSISYHPWWPVLTLRDRIELSSKVPYAGDNVWAVVGDPRPRRHVPCPPFHHQSAIVTAVIFSQPTRMHLSGI